MDYNLPIPGFLRRDVPEPTSATTILADDPALAEHAAEIRRLGKRLISDVIEIGRHLTEARAKLRDTVGHGHFKAWVDREFGWSDRTTLNFMRVHELSLKSETVSDLNLPMRELYLLAAPSTPQQARTEILDRAAAGEPVSGADVKKAIARAKRKQNGAAETGGTENKDDATTSAEARKLLYADADGADASAPAEFASNPAATAAAAVNQLNAAELQSFLDQLSPAHQRAFKQKFGARNSDSTNAEIATVASECSALLAHPEQNTDAIRKKLARIKKLTGFDGKAQASSAKLDRGAFARGMGMAGQPGEKFPTMNAARDSADGIWK